MSESSGEKYQKTLDKNHEALENKEYIKYMKGTVKLIFSTIVCFKDKVMEIISKK